MIKIRLARGGRTHKPVYTIVDIESLRARDGKFLEKLGQYNPLEKDQKQLLNINKDQVNAWLAKGAELSDTVRTLLKKHKVAL
jgi:small subunit ribosomal protein S16